MEFHFLGTGAGVPSKERNTSAIVLQFFNHYKGALWLFDCGEATQHRFLHTKLKLSKLTHIFITHLHGDHIYGLPGVLGSRSFQGAESPLTVYGPKGIRSYIETSLRTSATRLRYELAIIEIDDHMDIEMDQHRVIVRKLDHNVPSYGYRIEEKSKPGKLLVDRLKAAGVPPGPIYKELKQGKTITLQDGRTLCARDFLGPRQPGTTLAVFGDTRPCEQALSLASNADILIHEATFMEKDRKLAKDYAHSTTIDAAKLAKTANASALILTHISSRYQCETDHMLDEARKVFENTYIAADYFTFTVELR